MKELEIGSEEVCTLVQAKQLILLIREVFLDLWYNKYRDQSQKYKQILMQALFKVRMQIYLDEESNMDLLIHVKLLAKYLKEQPKALKLSHLDTVESPMSQILEKEIEDILGTLNSRLQLIGALLAENQVYDPQEQSVQSILNVVELFTSSRNTFRLCQLKALKIKRKKEAIALLFTAVPLENQSTIDRDCGICRKPFNSTGDGNSTVAEFPVTLLCGHAFGSACIATLAG